MSLLVWIHPLCYFVEDNSAEEKDSTLFGPALKALISDGVPATSRDYFGPDRVHLSMFCTLAAPY